MNSEKFVAWLEGYGRAWKNRDSEALVKLFSDNATYQETPFTEPLRGREAIREYWLLKVVRSQEQIQFGAEALAMIGSTGIAHWWAAFTRATTKARVKLDGVFLLKFGADGLCAELREWWVKQEARTGQ
jgi:hypothetical protein